MSRVTQYEIVKALSGVIDPDTGKDVVSSRLIQGLVVRDDHVGFSVEVAPERGPAMEPLRRQCEEAVRKIPGVLSVTVVLTAHRPAPKAPPPPPPAPAHNHDHGHGRARPTVRHGPLNIPGVAAIVAVASGKGGVGKSTVAVNIALGLARLGRRVGLLDADIYGPSIPRMLGIKGKPDVETEGGQAKKLKPMQNYGIKTMSIGFLVDEETPMIWRGPMVQSALTQMKTDVAWGELDVMIVDMPPGTGDAQLTMAQRVPLTGAIIVSTPQEIALIDARKGYAMFDKTHVPILGIVENMSYFVSPGSGEKSYIFGQGGARLMAEKLGCEFLGEVPLHMAVRETSDAGTPIVATQPESEEARIFIAIAEKVSVQIDRALEAQTRKAPKITIED
jgi:ATP-binding protein involved in chromosome partitioning